MVRSNIVSVTASKIPTSLAIEASPLGGTPPLTVTVNVLLLDANGLPLSDKPINIIVDGKVVTTLRTGFLGLFTSTKVTLQAGTHTIQAEFLGDATYEGCDEEAYFW